MYIQPNVLNSNEYTPGDGTRTITLNVGQTIVQEQLAYVFNLTQGLLYYAPAQNLNRATVSSGNIVIDDSFAVLASTDIIHIQIWKNPAYSEDVDILKMIEQANLDSRRVDVQSLLSSAQDLTASFADVGDEIPVPFFKSLYYFITVDINDSLDPRFKILAKHTNAGAEEYPLSDGSVIVHTQNSYSAAATNRYFELTDDENQLFIIEADIGNNVESLQLQASVGTVGATAGQIDAAYYTISY